MILVKIGGGKNINLDAITSDIAEINQPMIIIHGANSLRDELALQLNIEKKTIVSISGYESVLTTDEVIDLMAMSYAGLRNKQLVSLLQQKGVNAIGLSGIDGQLIVGRRNRGIKTIINGKKMILRDNSGKPQSVNKGLMDLLLDNGYIPVITQPIADEEGQLINSENDDIVALLANSYDIDEVVMLIEAAGFLRDIQDVSSLISDVEYQLLDKWLTNSESRMKRKLHAIKKIVNNGDCRVRIGDGRVKQPISQILKGSGTLFHPPLGGAL